MASILLINGPNLNLLGQREPSIYGARTLDEINGALAELAAEYGHELRFLQSNAEHVIIDRIHEAGAEEGNEKTAFIIINPAGLTHTSVVLRDALLGVKIPFIEVHLSNIHAREAFRHRSLLSDIARGTIVGLGPLGYELALRAAMHELDPIQPIKRD